MTDALWGKDRAGLMERLGRLIGQTTYREPASGGGSPFTTQTMSTEAKLLLALKMGESHPNDVGPWIVYSIALQIDDRQRQIVEWLARKLEAGTGHIGRRNARRMLIIALAAYNLAVHGTEPPKSRVRGNEFTGLANIGAGWIWVKCESTIERVVKAGRLSMLDEEVAA